MLGSAWPSIYPQFQVPVSYAGILSMIISLGTIVSSLQSDRLTRKLGTGKVTAVSVGLTAAALFGFSVSSSFWMLCLWAVPYGLGAGSVDASLNNYVALHYESRHMSWLHCMWGVGAAVGPYIMGFALTGGMSWNAGYRIVAVLQLFLTLILVFSLPLWKKRPRTVVSGGQEVAARSLSLKEILRIPGAKEVFIAFFCYCALGTDRRTLGQQLSASVQRSPQRVRGLLCQHVLYRHHGRPGPQRISHYAVQRRADDPHGLRDHRGGRADPAAAPGSGSFPGRTDRGRPGLRPGVSLRDPFHPRTTSERRIPRLLSVSRWPAPMWEAVSCRRCSGFWPIISPCRCCRSTCWRSWRF